MGRSLGPNTVALKAKVVKNNKLTDSENVKTAIRPLVIKVPPPVTSVYPNRLAVTCGKP